LDYTETFDAFPAQCLSEKISGVEDVLLGALRRYFGLMPQTEDFVPKYRYCVVSAALGKSFQTGILYDRTRYEYQ